MLSRLFALATGLILAATIGPATAKSVPDPGAVAANEYVLLVNEGVTYKSDGSVQERYTALVAALEHALHKPVRIREQQVYAHIEQTLAAQEVDFAFVHPAHIALHATTQGKYVGIATAKGYENYHATLMVAGDSPAKTVSDMNGKRLALPTQESITAVMFAAHMSDVKLKPAHLYYVHYQDGLTSMVQDKLVDGAVTGSQSVADNWLKSGGRIIDQSPSVPIKDFIVSNRVPAADVAKVRAVLLGLDKTEAGRQILEPMHIKGFTNWDDTVMAGAITRLGL